MYCNLQHILYTVHRRYKLSYYVVIIYTRRVLYNIMMPIYNTPTRLVRVQTYTPLVMVAVLQSEYYCTYIIKVWAKSLESRRQSSSKTNRMRYRYKKVLAAHKTQIVRRETLNVRVKSILNCSVIPPIGTKKKKNHTQIILYFHQSQLYRLVLTL